MGKVIKEEHNLLWNLFYGAVKVNIFSLEHEHSFALFDDNACSLICCCGVTFGRDFI